MSRRELFNTAIFFGFLTESTGPIIRFLASYKEYPPIIIKIIIARAIFIFNILFLLIEAVLTRPLFLRRISSVSYNLSRFSTLSLADDTPFLQKVHKSGRPSIAYSEL